MEQPRAPEQLDNAAIVAMALKRYAEAVEADRDNRNEALEDLKMLANKQWDSLSLQQRLWLRRPTLTINKLKQVVNSIVGEFRRAPPSLRYSPGDDSADAESAELIGGIVRAIERTNSAQREVYIPTLASAVACGTGSFRLSIEWEDDRSFDLALVPKRIKNPFAVVWDPLATRLDKSDARYCFLAEEVDEEEHRARFPGRNMGGWPVDRPYSPQPELRRRGTRTLTRMEYWTVTEVDTRLVQLRHRDSGAETILEDPDETLLGEIGSEWVVEQERVAQRKLIEMRLIAGNQIITGPFVWPGQRIPIFTACGEEVEVGEYTYRMGVIRNAKDAQRVFNLARSVDMETYSLAPRQPWLATAMQIEGREVDWANAHSNPASTLVYKADPSAPPPSRLPGQIATNPGFTQLAGQASDDIKAATGIYDASLGARSNETSGIAIEARKLEGDVSSYVYIDNFLNSYEALGREMAALVPQVYSRRHMVRILGKDDEPKIVRLHESDSPRLGVGRYDMVVETGPTFASKRAEAAAGLIDLVGKVPPQFAAVLIPEIAKLQNWEGAQDIARKIEGVAQAMGMVPPPEGAGAPGQPPGAAAPSRLPPEIEALLADIPAPAPGERLPPEIEELLASIPLSPDAAPAGAGRVGPRPPAAGSAGIQGALAQ